MPYRIIPYNLEYKPSGVNYTRENIRFHEIYRPFQSVLGFPNELYKLCADFIATPWTVHFPAACVVEADEGRIYATKRCIAIIDRNNLLAPDPSYHHVTINKFGDPADNDVFKIRFFHKPVRYKGTVFSMLSGAGAATNYGHWLIDAIPRIGLLKKSGLFDQVDWFLVPSDKYDYHIDSLAALGAPRVKLIPSRSVNHIQADRIIAASAPRYIGHFPEWAGHFLRDSYYEAIKPVKYPSRVYIRRSDSAIRRILNEDEIVTALSRYSFIDYELSRLSFAEKVNLFRSAEIVVSATGAGLSNLVFCKPGTIALEIFHAKFMSTMFADIATRMGLDYHYIIKDADTKPSSLREGVKGHYRLDVWQVLQKVEELVGEKVSQKG